MNVPKLRFKEFNDEWDYDFLKNISSEVSYGMNSASKEYDGENKYIRITDIDEKTNKYSYEDIVSPDGELEDKYLLKNNDILFARTGASTGKTYLYNSKDGKMYFAGFLIKANIINHNSNFIFQQTKLNRFNKWIKIMSMRSGQPGINSQEYGNYKFSLTSIQEENKISIFLSLLDKKIELQSKKIEALKLYKKGLLKKQYCYIKNINNIEISQFAQVYQPITLSTATLKGGKYSVFGANGIIGYHNEYNHEFEQVTISCRGENSGKINFTPKKCWINGNSMVINIDNSSKITKEYLYYILSSQNLNYLISGSGQPQITRDVVLKHKIPLIEYKQQLNYTKIFKHFDIKIKIEEQKLSKLESLKKGLMQIMFV